MKNRYKIFVTEPLPKLEVGFKPLRRIAEIRFLKEFTGKVLTDDIRDVDAIVAGDAMITRKSLEGVQRLKVIGRCGVGVDNVDLDACTEKGIMVFNAPSLNAVSVAEHAIGMMMAISKKFLLSDKLVRTGLWSEKTRYINTELSKKTVGIIGLGDIGRLVAKKVKAFDMEVLAFDPYVSKGKAMEVSACLSGLKTLLRESDFVSIHCPLTFETRGMIGEDELRSMKKTSILINTARGEIVRERALCRALKEGWIAGAGIDVFEEEPLATNHPFIELDNILLTPHSASFTAEAVRRIALYVSKNIMRVFNGQIPENIVNKRVLKKIS
jgi:D-3-phosphoglycerate dehydrogenase